MKAMKTYFVTAMLALISACGVKEQGSSLKDDAAKHDFASIGRGSKLILLKDIEIPANREQSLVGPLTYYTTINEYEGTEYQHYVVCGFYAREATLERRMIPKGSSIEFSGEATTIPNGENSDQMIDAVGITSPAAIEGLGCMKMIASCRGRICNAPKQTKFKIEDLRILFKDVATVELAAPVIITNK